MDEKTNAVEKKETEKGGAGETSYFRASSSNPEITRGTDKLCKGSRQSQSTPIFTLENTPEGRRALGIRRERIEGRPLRSRKHLRERGSFEEERY